MANDTPVQPVSSAPLPEAPAAGAPLSVAAIIENCLGCKWTLHVLNQVRSGVNRFTPFGERLMAILDQVSELQQEWAGPPEPALVVDHDTVTNPAPWETP